MNSIDSLFKKLNSYTGTVSWEESDQQKMMGSISMDCTESSAKQLLNIIELGELVIGILPPKIEDDANGIGVVDAYDYTKLISSTSGAVVLSGVCMPQRIFVGN